MKASKRPRSPFKGLPPIMLARGYAAWSGTVGTDANGRLLVEAGEDVQGVRYVSFISKAADLTPKVRRQIADKMIAIWETFAAGGKP